MPQVTVVIPTYNRARQIGRAIDSVIAQAGVECEIIVVDDGSRDAISDALRPYGDRIRYVRQDNAGPSAARNRGWRMAQHDWIAFLDSDDLWKPGKLRRQMELAERTGTRVCFTDIEVMGAVEPAQAVPAPGSAGKEVFEEPFELILQPSRVLYVQSMLIRRELLNRIGGFDERLRVGEDTKLVYELAFEAPFAFLDEPLVFLERSPARNGLVGDWSGARAEFLDSHIRTISQAYFRYADRNPAVTDRLRYILGHFLSLRAVMLCANQHYGAARHAAWDALHFGGAFRSYRRSLAVLLLPHVLGRLRRAAWRQ
jgi:glycosyltransferase involved in cell wall biosynthesis